MGLSIAGLQSAVQGAAATVANLVGQVVTALQFVSTQASGSDAFKATITGARWHIGPGTTDFLTSDGTTTITAAGDFVATATAQVKSTFFLGVAATANPLIRGLSQNAGFGFQTDALAASIGATPSTAGFKYFPAVALDATDWLFSYSDAANTNNLLALTYAGSIVVPNTDSTGTPGNATINQVTGRSSIAAGAATVTITNSLVTAASHVFIAPIGRDATGLLPVVATINAGNFTVTTTGNCTAALAFNWWVLS